MAGEAKSKIVIKNTMMGVLNNVILVALNLISRKLFLDYIGIEYLSIGQVINNVISVLAFSELGITNSVLFMLYKPVVENDEIRVAKIIGTYKKLNIIVGCAVFVIGLCCMPFLTTFIKTSISIKTVYLIFLMNLCYSAASYFCSYRQVLLNANQKNYIISKVSLGVNVVSIIVQCVAIFVTHSYIFYLLITIIMGLVQNVIVFVISGRMFPYLDKYNNEKLNKTEMKDLVNNVKSMFAVKVCGLVINNTDNILVSIIDTLAVGYISNYTTVSIRIRSLITIFHNSAFYSLGVVSVKKSAEEKYELFKKITLINAFISGYTALLMGVLWDDFIVLWIGHKYVISDVLMYSLLLNYMWNVIIAPVWMFRDTNGLFHYVKKMLLVNAGCNLVFSLTLGQVLGVAGVYFATILADIVTDFWFDAKLIYDKLFNRKDFWKYCTFILLNVGGVLFIMWIIEQVSYSFTISMYTWILKAVIASIVYVVVFLCVFSRTQVFKNIWNSFVRPKLLRRR